MARASLFRHQGLSDIGSPGSSPRSPWVRSRARSSGAVPAQTLGRLSDCGPLPGKRRGSSAAGSRFEDSRPAHPRSAWSMEASPELGKQRQRQRFCGEGRPGLPLLTPSNASTAAPSMASSCSSLSSLSSLSEVLPHEASRPRRPNSGLARLVAQALHEKLTPRHGASRRLSGEELDRELDDILCGASTVSSLSDPDEASCELHGRSGTRPGSLASSPRPAKAWEAAMPRRLSHCGQAPAPRLHALTDPLPHAHEAVGRFEMSPSEALATLDRSTTRVRSKIQHLQALQQRLLEDGPVGERVRRPPTPSQGRRHRQPQ